jgi:hypothetical protein
LAIILWVHCEVEGENRQKRVNSFTLLGLKP